MAVNQELQPGASGQRLWTSLDEYVDVDRLRALDTSLTERLHDLSTKYPNWTSRFMTWHTTHLAPEAKPKALLLTDKPNCKTYSEQMRDQRGFSPTLEASLFADLFAFIETMPFQYTGRILIIFDDAGLDTPAHVDHSDPTWRQEFIWFRPNLNKRFYVLDDNSNQKVYIDSYSAWFDTGKTRHGVDGCKRFAISIRVDGVFIPEFRHKLGWT
ncbi:hypothetical protein K2X85_19050 [bacterium]|nr:hypothetical protein [bacterium]